MNPPALMSRTDTRRYADFLAHLASISRGATREYYAHAASELRIAADFGGEDQRRIA